MKLDLTQLYRRAVLMQAAYEPWERCEAIVSGQGYEWAGSFEEEGKHGGQAYIAHNEHEIAYCFAGSNDYRDWLYNIDARRSPFQGNALNGWVHCGFQRSFNAISRPISRTIRSLLSEKRRPVVGIGHSAGAPPVAMMARAHLHEFSPESWLFACPNFCDRRFRRQYNDKHGNRTYEIRAMPDVVPLFPMLLTSVGQQFLISGENLIYWPSLLRRGLHHITAALWWAVDYFTASEFVPPGFRFHFSKHYLKEARRLSDAN